MVCTNFMVTILDKRSFCGVSSVFGMVLVIIYFAVK
jgi:hypothetical protein